MFENWKLGFPIGSVQPPPASSEHNSKFLPWEGEKESCFILHFSTQLFSRTKNVLFPFLKFIFFGLFFSKNRVSSYYIFVQKVPREPRVSFHSISKTSFFPNNCTKLHKYQNLRIPISCFSPSSRNGQRNEIHWMTLFGTPILHA